jgi:hypothetical protein
VLRRRRFPGRSVEPVSRRGESLGSKESRPERLLSRAGELNMVSELVGQVISQVGGGPGNTDYERRRTRVVLRTIVELPCCAHVDRPYAIRASRVRCEEAVPRLDRDRTEICRYRGIEPKLRTGVGAVQGHDNCDNGRRNDGESDCTTHGTSLTAPASGGRTEFD